MRIAFIGAHGTGKTTLAKIVAKELDLKYITETAVEVKNKYDLPLYPNSTSETQLLIFFKQLQKELDNKEGVFDRCLLDNIAYSIDHQLIKKYVLDNMIDIALQMIKEFDYLFLVTCHSDILEYNGYRDTELLGQMEIEYIILDLLQKYNLKYYLIHERDLYIRIKKVLDIIENNKLTHDYAFQWEDDGVAELAYFKCRYGEEIVDELIYIDKCIGGSILPDSNKIQCPYCNSIYEFVWQGMKIEYIESFK